MTKKELVEKIAEAYSCITDVKYRINQLVQSLEEAESILEDIPEDENSITDKEPEE